MWDLTHQLDLIPLSLRKNYFSQAMPLVFLILWLGSMKLHFIFLCLRRKELTTLWLVSKVGEANKTCYLNFLKEALGLSGEIQKTLQMRGIITRKIFPISSPPI